jgi:hypothetical protein
MATVVVYYGEIGFPISRFRKFTSQIVIPTTEAK